MVSSIYKFGAKATKFGDEATKFGDPPNHLLFFFSYFCWLHLKYFFNFINTNFDSLCV